MSRRHRGRAPDRPHGIYGRLRWSDLQTSKTVAPPGVPDDGFAEWIVEMPGVGAATGR